jgi:hypothetical protein
VRDELEGERERAAGRSAARRSSASWISAMASRGVAFGSAFFFLTSFCENVAVERI